MDLEECGFGMALRDYRDKDNRHVSKQTVACHHRHALFYQKQNVLTRFNIETVEEFVTRKTQKLYDVKTSLPMGILLIMIGHHHVETSTHFHYNSYHFPVHQLSMGQ